MKRIFTFVCLFFITGMTVRACDICGCGVGNFNPHLFPHLSKNYIGLSYYHRNYRTHFMENGEEIMNREYYNSFSITGQYSPFKNLQLMAVLPFQMNRQTGPEGRKQLSRPGDIVLMANYKFFDHTSGNDGSMLRQTWQAGAGVKLPTGDHSFSEANEEQVGNSNFQAGTGSTDLILSTSYSIRYNQFALGTGVTYKINGTNRDEYRFGNRFLNVTQVKYIRDIKNVSLITNIGLMYEHMQQDKQDGSKVIEHRTGGYNLQLLAGIDINTKKWALGINYFSSLKQDLALGQIHALPGFNIHLSYTL